ncbi:Slp family lipoprotein [Dyella sp.]|uniref:Slp family lipoprotein n=1 Tax=Dyella sp. TaxID=1869338 RepID=UPI002ED13931
MRFTTLLARLVVPATLLALVACAPAPLYKPSANNTVVSPAQVSQTPEQYSGRDVIWGGRIVQVNNLADHSEIEVLAYPLDSSQRPKLRGNGDGRFIAILPGYVESIDYPPGAPITIAGQLNGNRAGKVGEADYVFPLVKASQSHRWTAEELQSGKVSFGVGVGVGVGR